MSSGLRSAKHVSTNASWAAATPALLSSAPSEEQQPATRRAVCRSDAEKKLPPRGECAAVFPRPNTYSAASWTSQAVRRNSASRRGS
jgi:hypothetical protein